MKSFESFKIMERFVEEFTDKNLQLELENVLSNKKPFQNLDKVGLILNKMNLKKE